MIHSVSATDNIKNYTLKPQPMKKPVAFSSINAGLADPTQAIKAQLSVSMPISYTFIKDIKIPYSEPAKFYKLSNGQKVVILPKKGPTVVKSYFNVGSMNEEDSEKGIFHFIEHMKFNGSKHLQPGEFFQTVNKMGASTNASTGMSVTDYYVASQMLGENDLENTIKIHADMIQYPNHASEMVEKEKGPVTSEIGMVSDQPENVAMNNCLKNLFRIESPTPDLIAGSINTINSLTDEKVKSYDDNWYSPDNCTTVITGEVDPQRTIELVAKYFNSKKIPKPENRKYTDFKPITSPIRNDIIMPKAQNSTVILGFRGPENSSEKDSIVQLLLLSSLLSNKNKRISGELNKNHVTGTFMTERVGNNPGSPSAIMFLSQSVPEKTDAVLQAYYNAIQDIGTNPININELENMKRLLKMSFSRITENSHLLNSFIGSAMLNSTPDLPEKYLALLDSITVDDINSFAKEYLDLNKVSISVVHPEKTNISKRKADEPAIDVSRISQYRLPSNMTAVFNPNKSDIVNYEIQLDTHIPANVKPGTEEILSIMLNRGSAFRNYGQFYEEMASKGIEFQFGADNNSIGIYCDTTPEQALNSLNMAKEVLLHPRFSQKSFEYAKAVTTELLTNEEEGSKDLITQSLFPSLPDYKSLEKTIESLKDVTLEDVIGLYQYIIKNAQANFVMTAPVEKYKGLKENTISILSKNMPVFKPKQTIIFDTYKPILEDQLLKKSDKRIQADISEGYTFKTNFNPKDHLTFTLLNTILGGGSSSRLFNDLREEQKLAYRVESNISYHGNTGLMELHIKTTTDDPENNIKQYDNVKKSFDGFAKHVQKLKTEKVSQDELESAKLKIKTKLLDKLETSQDQTIALTEIKDSPYSINAINEYMKLIDSITVEDIHNAANYIFKDKSIKSIIASPDTLNNI